MTPERVLVTGGAGFIGSALVRHLAASAEVVVLDNMSRGARGRLDGVRCRVVQADVRDAEAVALAMHGCDWVLHLAFLQGTRAFYTRSWTVLDVALRGMLSVLDACAQTGCGKMLLVSSSEVYQAASVVPTPEIVPLTVPDPLNPRYSYGGGKIACELAALAWQRDGILDRLVIARPHNIIGPDMGRDHVVPEFALRMAALATQQPEGVIEFPVQGSGQETRSFCYIDDCVRQLDLLLTSQGERAGIWHVGNDDERVISDVAHAVAACYGREIKVVPGILQPGSPFRRCPDISRVRSLGYVQSVTFSEAIRRTAEWYQAHG
jgi:nucleoside-diphosphate-sugar epimerase